VDKGNLTKKQNKTKKKISSSNLIKVHMKKPIVMNWECEEIILLIQGKRDEHLTSMVKVDLHN
jgi:hypothetical protein